MSDHIPQLVILPEILRKAVALTKELSGIDVKFMHENSEQAEARLLELGQAAAYDPENPLFKKYPLILLIHDVPEKLGNSGGYYGTVTIPKIVILAITEPTFTSDKRLEVTFKPVLYPLLEWFKIALSRNRQISLTDPKNLVTTIWPRYYWGSKGAGKGLNDYLDGIELQNTELTLIQNC